MSRRVVALVAAAGQGTRLGAAVPKAYVELAGATLLERSVAAMVASGVVDELVVTVSPDMEATARELLANCSLPVTFVHGLGERADSVWAGLQAIEATDATVLIHDAARALTPPEMIARVARAVDSHPAVIPVLPVTDTIKEVNHHTVIATPDRSRLRAVQTPQGFDLAQLRAANEAYFAQSTPEFVATDDASLMEWHHVDVFCVEGHPHALKITTPIDLILAQALLEEQ